MIRGGVSRRWCPPGAELPEHSLRIAVISIFESDALLLEPLKSLSISPPLFKYHLLVCTPLLLHLLRHLEHDGGGVNGSHSSVVPP